jgi:hypothetical protein
MCQNLGWATLMSTLPDSPGANDRPAKYNMRTPEFHRNSDHAHRWAWKPQPRLFLTQVRSSLLGLSEMRIVLIRLLFRDHLRCHRGSIRRLCLRRLDMRPSCTLPTRPHRHPDHEREQQLFDGERRTLPRRYARTRWRGALRAGTWFRAYGPWRARRSLA